LIAKPKQQKGKTEVKNKKKVIGSSYCADDRMIQYYHVEKAVLETRFLRLMPHTHKAKVLQFIAFMHEQYKFLLQSCK